MQASIFSERDAARMRRVSPLLLEWYHKNARPLPWRENPSPYRVWVSEIMLQQTRVEAVRPYFARFMQTLPSIADLAAAPEEVLFKLWEGLGYYSRARNLQKAARQIMTEHGGRLPADHAALLGLPGIGPYTAGAIASIAFGLPAAAVDGNVLRVLSRILDNGSPMHTQKAKKDAESLIQSILPKGFAGDFNQSMMELGATVCVPGAPHCTDCPIRGECLGLAAGHAADLPIRPPKKARKILPKTVPVIVCEKGTLLRQRPAHGLVAGLWEFPAQEGWQSLEEVCGLVADLGGTPRSAYRLEDSRHIFTHLEWHMIGYLIPSVYFEPPPGWVWAEGDALRNTYALPSAYRVYMESALAFLSKQSLSPEEI